MVTKKKPGRRIYLKEHREAQGLSASTMAEKLGIERESVYRLEAKHWGVSSQKQAAYAAALGIDPQELWRLPDNPSLDYLVSTAPANVQESVHTLLKRLIPHQK